jgi:hypothetical protein
MHEKYTHDIGSAPIGGFEPYFYLPDPLLDDNTAAKHYDKLPRNTEKVTSGGDKRHLTLPPARQRGEACDPCMAVGKKNKGMRRHPNPRERSGLQTFRGGGQSEQAVFPVSDMYGKRNLSAQRGQQLIYYVHMYPLIDYFNCSSSLHGSTGALDFSSLRYGTYIRMQHFIVDLLDVPFDGFWGMCGENSCNIFLLLFMVLWLHIFAMLCRRGVTMLWHVSMFLGHSHVCYSSLVSPCYWWFPLLFLVMNLIF